MSFDRESQTHAAFERRLLESARKDAPPGDVQDAWTRFAGAVGPLVSCPGLGSGPHGPQAPVALASASAAVKAVEVQSAWASVVKWLLLGAIGGSSLTAGWMMQRRDGRHDSPVPLLERAPARLSEPNNPAAVPSPLSSPSDQPTAGRAKTRPVQRGPKAAASGQHSRDETADTVALDASTLAAEVARIDTARAASATGDYAEAIRLVDRYHRDYPKGALAPDADVVALEALAAKRDRDEIGRRAALFLSRYPADPHAARVRWLAEHIR